MSKLCWVITGAGHFLKEVVDILLDSSDVDIFITRAAKEVALQYSVTNDLLKLQKTAGANVQIFFEIDYSSQPLVKFSSRRYNRLVIAPATSNTVAKCALGIADSLASNFFSQAGKSLIPIVVLPTDIKIDMSSVTPSGRSIRVNPRAIDLEHVRRLESFDGVTVVKSPEELTESLRSSSVDGAYFNGQATQASDYI